MKSIPSAPGYYADAMGGIWRNGHRLKEQDNGHGHKRLKTSVGGVLRDRYVHRLVCQAFHGPPPEGLECRHLDGVRSNNQAANLQWSDKRTNEMDKHSHGTNQPTGERHKWAIMTTAVVITARKRAAQGERVDEIAIDLGVPGRALLSAVTGRNWRHLPGPVKNLVKGAQRQQAARKEGTPKDRPRNE